MKKKISPYIIILASFILLILVGSILLILPFSLKEGIKISYIDALFISTSNVTITGLTPLVIADTFNLFGRIVLVLLMQIGGLSVTTLAFFIIYLFGAKISYSSRQLVKENVSMNSMRGVVRVIRKIVLFTLIIQSIGIITFTILFTVNGTPFIESLGYSVFHTVASFNNSGFDIFGSSSLVLFKSDVLFNVLTMTLIVLGGLGSLVVVDVITKRSWKKLTFHSRIVIKMTVLLLLVGSVSFFLIEKDATILESLFHSVTLRTAGFYSYDYGVAAKSTLLISMFLMFIGGAPASTAGGIKVTTMFTLYKTSNSFLKDEVATTDRRKIPDEYQKKALMTFFLGLNIVILATFLLSIFEPQATLTSVLFEVFSAFSNTGLSLSLTPTFGVFSKILVMILMLIGRVGILTFIQSLISKNTKASQIEYVDLEYIL